jgi:hypothetical protein
LYKKTRNGSFEEISLHEEALHEEALHEETLHEETLQEEPQIDTLHEVRQGKPRKFEKESSRKVPWCVQDCQFQKGQLECSHRPNCGRGVAKENRKEKGIEEEIQKAHAQTCQFLQEIFPQEIPQEEEIFSQEIPQEEEIFSQEVPQEKEIFPQEIPQEEEIFPQEIPQEEEIFPQEIPQEEEIFSQEEAQRRLQRFYQQRGCQHQQEVQLAIPAPLLLSAC